MLNWREAMGIQTFELRRFLCTESEQLIWKSEGLPSDDLSVENALVIRQVCTTIFQGMQNNRFLVVIFFFIFVIFLLHSCCFV